MKIINFVATLVLISNISACRNQFQFIELDHQDTYFKQEQKVIALKNSNINRSCSYNFQVTSQTECGEAIRMWYTNGTNQFVFHAHDLTQANTLIILNLIISEIRGISGSCPWFQQIYFQLDPYVTTELVMISQFQDVCVSHELQRSLGVLNVILPTASPCQPDCICPVVIQFGQDCYDFLSCSCIIDTPYHNSLRACLSQLSLQICIRNYTDKMNDTNIYLIITKDANCNQHNTNYRYRKYIKSIKVISGIINTNVQMQNISFSSENSPANSFLFKGSTQATSQSTVTMIMPVQWLSGSSILPKPMTILSVLSSPPPVQNNEVISYRHSPLVYLIGGVLFTFSLTLLLITLGSCLILRTKKVRNTRYTDSEDQQGQVQDAIYEDIETLSVSHAHSQFTLRGVDGDTTMTQNPLYNKI